MSFEHLVIRVSGSALERGRQYGEKAKDRIAKSIELYSNMFEANAHLSWEKAKEVAKQFEGAIKAYFPEAIEEMQGIAQGASLTYEDILAKLCLHCLTAAPQLAIRRNQRPTVTRCSHKPGTG